MKVFLAAILLVGICVLLLSVGILFKRGFPQYDVGSNEDERLHRRRVCSGNFSDACADCTLYKTNK